MSNEAQVVADGVEIRAEGHVEGTRFQIVVSRGPAKITLDFDATEEPDENGMGSVDILVAALPDAAAQVMDALLAQQEAAGE